MASSNGLPASTRGAFRLTPAGRWWILITLLFVGIAVGKSINLLMLLAYTMVAVFLLNVLSARAQTRHLRGRRRLPDLVFARTSCTVELEVENRGRAKAMLILEERGPEHALTWSIPWLRQGELRTCYGQAVLPRRGRYRWDPIIAGSGYPFGLLERRRPIGIAEDVIVLPALGGLHRGRFLRRLLGGSEREEVRRKPRRHPIAQVEFHGLRPFRTGDSPHLIHWRTSARRGELMTREYEDAPGQNLIVVLDTGLLFAAGAPQFEAAVSFAATVCWEWCRRRGERLIVGVSGTEPVVLDDLSGPDHGRRVLEALALAQPSAATDSAALLDRLTVRPLPPAALVVVGAGPGRLAASLGDRLHRAVVYLDVAEIAAGDFYDPPV